MEPHRALWGQHEIVTLHAIEYWHGVIAYFEVPIGVFGAGIKKHRGHGYRVRLEAALWLLERRDGSADLEAASIPA